VVSKNLLQNYPNPFNPETWIPYQLATDSPVMISIYNSKGQLIRVLNLGNQNAGIYMTKNKAAYWDGKDRAGEKVASGVYFYTLQVERQRNLASILGTSLDGAGEFRCTRKMVIMK
jgi:flagellar hook assembly protein FlgD